MVWEGKFLDLGPGSEGKVKRAQRVKLELGSVSAWWKLFG